MRSFGPAAAVAVAVVAALWWAAAGSGRPDKSTTADGGQEFTAAELIELAHHFMVDPPPAMKSGDADVRVDSLLQMAARRQIEQPQEIPAAWEQYQQLLADLKGRGASPEAPKPDSVEQLDREVGLLVQYGVNLEAAALASRRHDDWDLAWRINECVEDRLRTRRTALSQAIQRKMPASDQEDTSASLVTELQRFAARKQRLDGPIVTLIATLDANESDDSLLEILGRAQAYVNQAARGVQSIATQAKEYRGRLHDPQQRIAPAPIEKDPAVDPRETGGHGEQLLKQLVDLEDAVVAADLTSWTVAHDRLQSNGGERRDEQTTPRGDDAPPDSESPDGRVLTEISRTAATLSTLQQLAYNLWAIREIQAAEEIGDNWDARLAPIETGLLHPTVAALYSSAYGELIGAVDDPVVRAAKAQAILIAPKVQLTAF